MKILVCGDRDWWDKVTIQQRLKNLAVSDVVIHGDARGADRMAMTVALEMGFPAEQVIAYPADWVAHGKRAGPIRNRQMLDQKPDLVIAFHDDIENSKGTKDCVGEAKRRRIPVEIIQGRSL